MHGDTRPSHGRFIQPDSIIPDMTNRQAWNRFSNVINSPVMYVDPSGHWEELPNSAHCPDGDCSLFPPPYGGGGKAGSKGNGQPGDVDEDLELVLNRPNNEITGIVIYNEVGVNWIALLPVFPFSSNRFSFHVGTACMLVGVDAGKCTFVGGYGGGKGLGLPGVAGGSFSWGVSLLLNTETLGDLEGVEFSAGIEFEIQGLAELGIDASYSWAIGPDGKPLRNGMGQ